ncbi:MAG TPA: TIM barrel protein [Phycisphaerae bacterium]|jgi:hydroxypyruvate isomerase
MDRRTFLATGVAAGAATALQLTSAVEAAAAPPSPGNKGRFKLKYAPHFGMFKHHAGDDPLDQLKFMADQGFTAFEDNGMMDRPVDLQEKIGGLLAKLDMTMGVFVAYAEFGERTFVHNDKEVRAMLKKKMAAASETARRVNAKWTTVVPGQFDPGLEWGYQTANVIDNLKGCAEVCEKTGLVMVLESLNPWRDHPGLFLTKIAQAYQICRAVNSPACKILDDMYHQQITEGNLIPNIDLAFSEIAYFQIGDNPGRNEPTTGEVNFRNVFRHIHARGFEGVLGMEHGNSKPGTEGEKAVIDAYLYCDGY